jgi:hypothetical protein
VIRWLVLLVTIACTPGPNPPPSPITPTGVRATCAGACANLRSLGCPDGDPTPEGETCEAICENARASDGARLDIACLQAASSCEVAVEC